MKNVKKLGLLFVSAFIAVSFAACGASGGSAKYESAASTAAAYNTEAEGDYYDYGYYDEEGYREEPSTEADTSKAEEYDDSSRKLIKTHNVDVETEDFDGFVAMVESKVSQLGGYIQNLNTYNGSSYSSYKSKRYSNLTLRIPVKQTDEFLKMVGENANITNQSLSVEDVTLSYVDLESKKKTYKAEEERLLVFLEQAETIEDMLTIEQRLTDIRYQLESMESQLRTYDNLVDYTTIYMNISEVEVYTEPEPESYGEQVSRSFSNGISRVVKGFKNFLIDFVGALPGLVVFLLVCFIIFVIVMAIVKGAKKSTAKKNAQRAAMAYAAAQAQAQQMQAQQVQPTVTQEDNTNGQ